MIQRTIVTDILCVGGSGAGVMSAVIGAKQGLAVTLISKGKVGHSGNIIMAGGGFGIDGQSGVEILNDEFSDPSFTRDKMFDCIVKESFFLADQNMVQQYVDESAPAIKLYLEWANAAKCNILRYKPCNWMSSGLIFARALRQGIKHTPSVNLLEDTTVVELLKKDGRVTGAIAIDLYTGELIEVQAKVVILGTGGFQPFTMKNTVSDMTGDGHGMAYRAGAKLTDMEFLLAFPTAVYPQDMRGSIYPFVFELFMPSLHFKMVDKNGNPLPVPEKISNLTRGTKLSKLASCFYMGTAIDQGLGGPNGGAYYDYSGCSKDAKDLAFSGFHNRFDRFHKHGYYKGESLDRVKEIIYSNQLLEVGLGFEYCMGGIQVNEKMETGVPGLLAAGEVTSGVFGACRAGDGLTEMLAQGMRAGYTAAEYCNASPKIDNDQLEVYRACQHILHCFNCDDGINAIDFYNQLEIACDKGFSVIRSEEGLTETLGVLLELKSKLKNVTIRNKGRTYNFEWLRALQAENMLTCCEAGVRAAITRKESRGCHIRKDYPQVDHDRYLYKYVFSIDGNEMHMDTRRPVVTKMELPTGTQENVIEYFMDENLKYGR